MSDCKTPCNKFKERLERLEAENVYLKKLVLTKMTSLQDLKGAPLGLGTPTPSSSTNNVEGR